MVKVLTINITLNYIIPFGATFYLSSKLLHFRHRALFQASKQYFEFSNRLGASHRMYFVLKCISVNTAQQIRTSQ